MPARLHIDLVAKLNRSRDFPDYDIFAANQRVGRIYLMHQMRAGLTERLDWMRSVDMGCGGGDWACGCRLRRQQRP
jgi:hypothetical protein